MRGVLRAGQVMEWKMHGRIGRCLAAGNEEIRLVCGMSGVVAVTLVLLLLQF